MAAEYKITVERIDKDIPFTERAWKQLRNDEDKDPSGKNQLYGYVESEITKDVSTKIFEQTVEELDIAGVVLTINKKES